MSTELKSITNYLGSKILATRYNAGSNGVCLQLTNTNDLHYMVLDENDMRELKSIIDDQLEYIKLAKKIYKKYQRK